MSIYRRIQPIQWAEPKQSGASTTNEAKHAVNKLSHRALQWFSYFDRNADKLLTAKEFHVGLAELNVTLSKEEEELLFGSFDRGEKDGKVDFNEFLDFLKKEPITESRVQANTIEHVVNRLYRVLVLDMSVVGGDGDVVQTDITTEGSETPKDSPGVRKTFTYDEILQGIKERRPDLERSKLENLLSLFGKWGVEMTLPVLLRLCRAVGNNHHDYSGLATFVYLSQFQKSPLTLAALVRRLKQKMLERAGINLGTEIFVSIDQVNRVWGSLLPPTDGNPESSKSRMEEDVAARLQDILVAEKDYLLQDYGLDKEKTQVPDEKSKAEGKDAPPPPSPPPMEKKASYLGPYTVEIINKIIIDHILYGYDLEGQDGAGVNLDKEIVQVQRTVSVDSMAQVKHIIYIIYYKYKIPKNISNL